MLKKIGKFFLVIFILFIALLIAAPYFLESKIDDIVKNYADKNLNATVSFDKVSLSLISSFPKANVTIDNLLIETLAPFKDETLLSAKQMAFEMPIMDIFKDPKKEAMEINEIFIDEFLLTLKTNASGSTNYDIVKTENSETNSTESDTTTTGFNLDLKDYEIKNSAFTYIDNTSNLSFYITNLYHSGHGNFTEKSSELVTETKAKLAMEMDSVNYIDNANLKLDAILDLNLKDSKYSFKKNKGFINALPIEFEGFVQLLQNGQNLDITFKNPDATFKDFLGLIPETYSKNLEGVKTYGNFTLNGMVKGILNDDKIPLLDINMVSNNASFKYPNLPKQVENINLNASVKNKTGFVKDTYIDLNTLDFKIDKDVFKTEAHIKNLTENIGINAKLNGVLNLGNLSKAYPVDLDQELSGILKSNLVTSFDMNAIETNAYDRINSNGTINLSNFVVSSEDLLYPLQVNDAKVKFSPGHIVLEQMNAQTGKSDFIATGTIDNLFAFILGKKDLEGNFNVNSNRFVLADFVSKADPESKTTSTTKTETTGELNVMKIPKFLDCTLNAFANEVVYDDLTLKNVNGTLRIKDQNAHLSNMTTDVFGGQIALAGNVSTKNTKPSFDVDLGLDKLNISDSFRNLKLLKFLAPVANVLEGKLNSTINLSGLLNGDFTPDLNTVTGDLVAQLLSTNLKPEQSPLLNQLTSKVNFLNMSKVNLDNLKASMSFENGTVALKPVSLNYEDIDMEISGTHSLTNKMNYNVVFDVPATYLGGEVNRLIGKIDDKEVDKISIPVTANLTGSFSNPSVKTDMTSGVKNLTNQLIKIQKQKLVNKGKNQVNDLLGGLLNGNSKNKTTKDSTNVKKDSIKDPTKSVEKKVNNVLNNLLKGKKKKKQ